MLFTLEEIKKIFNSQNVTADHIAISICNGDGNAFPSHLESVTVVNNNWYVVFKDILKINMNCRVQYVIFYWGNNYVVTYSPLITIVYLPVPP